MQTKQNKIERKEKKRKDKRRDKTKTTIGSFRSTGVLYVHVQPETLLSPPPPPSYLIQADKPGIF